MIEAPQPGGFVAVSDTVHVANIAADGADDGRIYQVQVRVGRGDWQPHTGHATGFSVALAEASALASRPPRQQRPAPPKREAKWGEHGSLAEQGLASPAPKVNHAGNSRSGRIRRARAAVGWPAGPRDFAAAVRSARS